MVETREVADVPEDHLLPRDAHHQQTLGVQLDVPHCLLVLF